MRVSEIQAHVKSINWNDWMTMGVLVETSMRKKSVNVYSLFDQMF